MTTQVRVEFWITRICYCLSLAFLLAGFWHHGEVKASIAKSRAEGKASSICFKSGGNMKDGECKWDMRVNTLSLQVSVRDVQLSGVSSELRRCEEQLHEERLARNVCSRVVAIETIDVEGSVER